MLLVYSHNLPEQLEVPINKLQRERLVFVFTEGMAILTLASRTRGISKWDYGREL